MTLVVLAGGFGTRFGGPKQFMEVGTEGECLFHYSISQAHKAGFSDFILLTRREIQTAAMRALERVRGKGLKVEMVFQDTSGGKAKGTGHAVLSCRHAVGEQFLVCNGDDFYGQRTFDLAAELVSGIEDGAKEAVMVPFQVVQTLSKNGGGSRAKVEADGEAVSRLTELRDVQRDDSGVISGVTEVGARVELIEEQPVSMNIFGFGKGVFGSLGEYSELIEEEFPGKEVGLPQFLNWRLRSGTFSLKQRTTPDRWFGLTFPEDLESVRAELAKLGPAF